MVLLSSAEVPQTVSVRTVTLGCCVCNYTHKNLDTTDLAETQLI
jgi:hypothetical protein